MAPIDDAQQTPLWTILGLTKMMRVKIRANVSVYFLEGSYQGWLDDPSSSGGLPPKRRPLTLAGNLCN
ncbi:hypothetical protein CFIMG_003080RA [Ceratocystis fimbriata CBS 114723]|uniref:Uncharacterized protein n=1 Tax=Ceratocystis fimbriata CBS 114723 TaxID=1035309 RepID=A0A2C5X3G0_9PEZI|nr:hypothetical protein CFIMG_003080RA [Ceratocystis fimbriata CBS 114723]